MKSKLFLCILMAGIACKSSPKHQAEDHVYEADTVYEEEHDVKTPHGSANEYMHQSSTASLIERFESPERDAYQKPAEVIAYLGDIQGKKIMDIGAGSGYFSIPLAEAGAQVVAADVDDEFQAYIKKRIQENGWEDLGIELRKIPYDSPALEKGEMDVVFIVNTYHHIENRIPYFKEVLEGIAEGGELFIVDYFKKDLGVGPPLNHKISKEKVQEELKEAGFTQIEVNTELLEYQYIIRAK